MAAGRPLHEAVRMAKPRRHRWSASWARRRYRTRTVRRRDMTVIVTGAAGFRRRQPGQGAERAGRDRHRRRRQPDPGREVPQPGRLRDRRLPRQGRLPVAGGARAPWRGRGSFYHQGACSDTMESTAATCSTTTSATRWSCSTGARRRRCRSSTPRRPLSTGWAVYAEARGNEKPLNVYGYSKFLFDQIVRRRLPRSSRRSSACATSNVYGPREAHKGRMARWRSTTSTRFRAEAGRLFEGSHGYAAGEQARRLHHVDDAVAVKPVLRRAAGQRHLQRRHRPRAALQRHGAGGGQHADAARDGPGAAAAFERSRRVALNTSFPEGCAASTKPTRRPT